MPLSTADGKERAVKEVIMKVPSFSADYPKAPIYAADLVRCKECKYKRIYDGETKYYYCALEDRPNRQWSIDEMDYCSWGEREGE